MFSLFQEYEHFNYHNFRQNKTKFKVVIILYILIGIAFELVYFLAYKGEIFQNFWETNIFLFISLVARYNQFEIYWIFLQGILDIKKIKMALTMTKDMFTIKPVVKEKKEFEETSYCVRYKKYLEEKYPKLCPQLLNFYEMPEIDITDIGSIRSAY